MFLREKSQAFQEPTRWHELAAHERLVLLVDLDGTLIEFASTPDEAELDLEPVLMLSHLVGVGVRVVIVSGRPKESIDEMRGLVPGAWWVAEHGSWRWDPELTHEPASCAPELDTLAARLDRLLNVQGVLVERKSLSLCIHWRRVGESARAELVRAVETVCDEWLEEQPAFERLGGVELLEIRQRSANKGSVVRWVRERVANARIIAIGDDLTDEDMFAELDHGDASVRVGTRLLRADAHAADVGAVHLFLRWIGETRRGADLPLPIERLEESSPRKRYRLVVMSNRTPSLTQGRTREVGGLVSALEPALRDEQGVWLGWSGQQRGHETRVTLEDQVQPVRARFDLPDSMREQFYTGFCNRVLWPLFHGFPTRVRYADGDWEAYVAANARYAGHAAELAQRDSTIWVHDYHLLLVARALRALGHQGPIGLFLHIPFPPRDVLDTVPWGNELVDAMREFDLIGFQTNAYASHFRSAARRFGRIPQVDAFPATIDPGPFRAQLDEANEVAGLRTAPGDRRLILGVDRLDYSKGIPERLTAYERLLERFPHWRKRVALLQISVPTRAEIPDYAELRQHVEGIVGRINGRFGEADWVPVRYLYRSYDHDILAQLYRLADVALVTPLRDGMNLVAKEFVAAQDPARPGVLVLSQYAGAADALASALITNPFHPEGMAADIDLALRTTPDERQQRHRMLLAALEREGDAKAWARCFLDRLASSRSHSSARWLDEPPPTLNEQ